MRLTFTVTQMLKFVDERLKADAVAAQISKDHRPGGGQSGGGGGGQGNQGGQKKPQQQQQQPTNSNKSNSTMGSGFDGTSRKAQQQMRALKALIVDNAEELLADVALAAPNVFRNNSNNKNNNNKSGGQKQPNSGTVATVSQNNQKNSAQNKGTSNPNQAKPAANKKDGTAKNNQILVDPNLVGKCLWCMATDHGPHNCPQLKNIPVIERWDKLRARWRVHTVCQRCLLEGHKSPNCPKQKICGVAGCGHPHATPLHPGLDANGALVVNVVGVSDF